MKVCANPSCGAQFERHVGRPSRYCPECCRTRPYRLKGPQTVEAVCQDCKNPFAFTQLRSPRRFCESCRVRRRAEQLRYRPRPKPQNAGQI
jgi:hypothetical protein